MNHSVKFHFAPIALLACSLVLAKTASAQPIEPWADASLPVKGGLTVWLDATRQSAAWDANGRALVGGELLDVFYDASGRGRDFSQPLATAQPRFVEGRHRAAVRFDGKDDHLRFSSSRGATLKTFTAFLVTSVRTNEGDYRAFLAAHATGKNDYTSGFNIDLGPKPMNGMAGIAVFNVEGNGHVGVQNLLKAAVPFEEFHVFTVTSAPGDGGVQLHVDGKPHAARDRVAGEMSIEDIVLAARVASNIDAPPFLQGFLDGDVAEVLLYDRTLNNDERAAVEKYLSAKHEGAADALARRNDVGRPLLPVENPPPVQMFPPGFTARRIPVDLTNINNLRYRDDGKLVALAYDGNAYLLSDTNGDGVEDKADLFWNNEGRIKAPVGMALTPPNYPHGRGMFIPSMGKLSLVVDTDGDDKADKEIVVAEGWPKSFVNVDATGCVMDRDGSVYFGIGTANFTEPLLIDNGGKSQYDLKGERGTIIRVAPDLKSREIVCTGIRFAIGMAFDEAGDLFCNDQEGGTWVPNGNPFDELLHVQRGRHYGFPPRHPKHLPNVIDEPSTFDYAPQHQSTCGMFFNLPVNGGPTFGLASWRGDAIVCGSSRGKIYRTRLAKTPSGYVAQNQVIGSVPMLLIDACLSPAGDVVLAMHSGNPDWGSGPTGKGQLYKVSYRGDVPPQPVLCWPAGPGEVRVAFDRTLDPNQLAGLAKSTAIEFGAHVGTGDRFEKIRPGYAIVKRQMREPRMPLNVLSAAVSRDGRTLSLTTAPQSQAATYAVTLPPLDGTVATPLNTADLAYDLTGVVAAWSAASASAPGWSGWLPHPDLAAARAFTAGSAQHDALWPLLSMPGRLTLRTSLDLSNMLRPAIQPGSRIDHTPPPETVTVTVESNVPIELRTGAATSSGKRASVTVQPVVGKLLPVEIAMPTGGTEPTLSISFTTNESDTPRPLALRRFLLPWAKLNAESAESIAAAAAAPPEELKGGDWLRGRQVFFGNEAGCYKCHQVRGQGSDLGPDLSNLIHRDYESVLRDIREPSGALNPDYIASTVAMKDGRVFHGIVRPSAADPHRFVVRGDYEGERATLKRSDVRKTTASPLSVMPTGLAEGIGPEKTRDLLTFLLTEPLAPAPIERKGAPPPRPRAEVDAVLGSIGPAPANQTSQTSYKPLTILLVAGPKDHGPSEHDYPAWQKRWTTLLALADGVTIDQVDGWPTAKQWQTADVAILYSANPAWAADKGKDIDTFLTRGGGIVFLHFAVNGGDAVEPLAERIGLASRPGVSKFRHGTVDLSVRDTNHPITRGLSRVHFVDETYWDLAGDVSRIHVLADASEEGRPRPQLWTREQGKGRVVVNILGHYSWTFDDPLFRVLVLRSICWSAGESADRLSGLATIGARIGQ
jgi:putative heme-binding domain-containing protein